jgi:hypothetical protein
MSDDREPELTGVLAIPTAVWLELFYDFVFVAAILEPNVVPDDGDTELLPVT